MFQNIISNVIKILLLQLILKILQNPKIKPTDKMKATSQQKSELQKYYLIKKQLQLPVKVRLYFLIFQNALDQTKISRNIQSKRGFSKALLNAFSNLSNSEKGHYLYSNMLFVKEQMQRIKQDKQKISKLENDGKLGEENILIDNKNNNATSNGNSSLNLKDDQIKNIQTTCQMLLTTLKINYWTTVSLKLDKLKKLLSITNKKKCFIIDMTNYFVRKSNKYKYSIVMEAITQQINNEGKKYIFSFSMYVVNNLYEEMLKCCLSCQHEKLLALLMDEDKDKQFYAYTQEDNKDKDRFNQKDFDKVKQKDNQHSHQTNQKALVFLNSKNINDYLSYKQKIQKQIMQNKFDFKPLFVGSSTSTSPLTSKLKIEQSSKIQKVFRLENIYDVDSKQLKQKFMYALTHKNKYIIDSQLLQQFSKKYKALYQKLSINNRLYEYISIRQQAITSAVSQQQILFVKGVQNIMGRNYIQFIQVRVRTISPVQSKLIIYLSIGLNAVITREVVKSFMIQFHEMIYRVDKKKQVKIKNNKVNNSNKEKKENQVNQKQLGSSETEQSKQTKQNQGQGQGQGQGEEGSAQNQQQDVEQNEDGQQDDDDFRTIKGSQQYIGYVDDGDEDQSQFQQPSTFFKKMSSILSNSPQKQKQKTNKYKYLFVKHSQKPVDSKQYHKFMIQHYLFKQWKRLKAGGVLCVHQETVNKQKKMFKQAISKLGKNILKGQILKMSFPVIMLKKQSHLQSIARNFCYAPMFFDRIPKDLSKQSLALERIKYATLLAISVGTLGISMEKPFNPILGQTFQVWIDGCPVYLEQLSHHPPVGAYYFCGRGYRIHGQIQPKVNFGLNNVKGFSSRPNHLQFQDGTNIEMAYGKMVIKGLLFGDRQFNFQDKVYAYDKTNHIFAEINYGPRKKPTTKKHDPLDFVFGSIYKLKPQFLQKFLHSSPKIFPKPQHIIQQLSKFQGIWNSQISFDDKVYVDFDKNLPYALVAEQNPLLSNSTYRTDLLKWIANNQQEAQKEKERLEEIQRRDRKLREKGEKGK